MRTEFKVGDRVKMVNPSGGHMQYSNGTAVKAGDIIEITYIDYTTETINFTGSSSVWAFGHHWFELVQKPYIQQYRELLQEQGIDPENIIVGGTRIEAGSLSDCLIIQDGVDIISVCADTIDEFILSLMYFRERLQGERDD